MYDPDATNPLQNFGLEVSEATTQSIDRSFRKQTEQNEQVLISRFVHKINRRSREQERLILISTEAVYNISGKSVKRKIILSKLHAVTISRTSYEFVLHVPDEYDYRFRSVEHRDLIIQYITVALHLYNNSALKCYFVDQDDLNQFTLQEKTNNLEKQVAMQPKIPPVMIMCQNFQLDFANHAYSAPNNMVLFIRNSLLLRAKLEDFSKQLVLGHGSLCKTYLVTQKAIQQFLVLKSLNKQDVDMDLMELYLKNYQEHPFIETLELVFLQHNRIHFLFQLKRGGDLYQHIVRQMRPFSENQSKFIVSQIALALQYLHEQGIVYGDLKPENILFDENGYVSLTDFGYGKMRFHRSFRKQNLLHFTPEYCPPEYLKTLELTRMADWYQLGILLYEMLVGIPPFYHPTLPEITIELSLRGQLHFPHNMDVSDSCLDFMTQLLNSDSASRLGFQSDFKEISAHPWLENIDVAGLKAKKIDLPYKPKVCDQQINENYFQMEQITEEDKYW